MCEEAMWDEAMCEEAIEPMAVWGAIALIEECDAIEPLAAIWADAAVAPSPIAAAAAQPTIHFRMTSSIPMH